MVQSLTARHDLQLALCQVAFTSTSSVCPNFQFGRIRPVCFIFHAARHTSRQRIALYTSHFKTDVSAWVSPSCIHLHLATCAWDGQLWSRSINRLADFLKNLLRLNKDVYGRMPRQACQAKICWVQTWSSAPCLRTKRRTWRNGCSTICYSEFRR